MQLWDSDLGFGSDDFLGQVVLPVIALQVPSLPPPRSGQLRGGPIQSNYNRNDMGPSTPITCRTGGVGSLSAALFGLMDCSQADMPGSRYKSVNFGAKRSPVSIDW